MSGGLEVQTFRAYRFWHSVSSFFAMLFAIPKWTLTTELLFVGLVAAIAYQLKMVLPYTPIWKKQVQKVKPEQINENQQISLLVANVLTPNDKYHLLLEHIDTKT
jgi:hypothetical protein